MRAGSRGINLYRWLRIRIAKRKKPYISKGQLCSQETIIVLLEAWVRGSSGNELFQAAGACSGSRSGPAHSLTSWGCNKRPAPSPFTLLPSIHQLSCSSSWICPSPCAPGEGCEFSSGGDWICIHFWLHRATEMCHDTWLLLQGVSGVCQGASLSRMNKIKEYRACSNSFEFEKTAKKEKCEHFCEMSIMVTGRNIKFSI